MLDIRFIRDNPEVVRKAIKAKKFDVDLDRLLELDAERRRILHASEALRTERNALSQSVRKASPEERAALTEKSREVGKQLKSHEKELPPIVEELEQLMLRIPGIPAPEVPEGDSEEDNEVIRHWGEPRQFDFEPRDHVELCRMHGLVDFERPPRFAGSRAYALKGDGVLLEQALLRYALDIVIADGFTAVSPPVLVREEAMVGTGFFPLGHDDTYRTARGPLFLVGTSEVSLVSLHADEILDVEELPIRYAGLSPCFRREAGAAGRDTHGLYRVHQFMKVEQVIICENDEEMSLREHMRLLGNSERVLQGLKLPHRVALACTMELGLGQVRKHEVETWMPSREAYCETHSCSTLLEFQSRRSKIRYRPTSDSKPQFVHTLNNTALASPRILIPVLEHYQNADGSITIPEVLRPYMGGRELLTPKA
ncbi:MAG: serine--tRNA ligase [Deltaproteobacteria bacterium]|nr:serine--tRNA ligase [Deltaproteobacteria bacterium]